MTPSTGRSVLQLTVTTTGGDSEYLLGHLSARQQHARLPVSEYFTTFSRSSRGIFDTDSRRRVRRAAAAASTQSLVLMWICADPRKMTAVQQNDMTSEQGTCDLKPRCVALWLQMRWAFTDHPCSEPLMIVVRLPFTAIRRRGGCSLTRTARAVITCDSS